MPGVYVHDHCGTGLCRLYAFHVTVGLFFVILIILQQLLFFLCVYLGYKILKGLFNDGLKVYVYGEHNVVAVLCGRIGKLSYGAAVFVFLKHPLALTLVG